MSLESRCFVYTDVLKQYVSAGEHHDGDNASAPVSSVTQLDIWPSIQENTEMFSGNQHAGGFLHHGNDQRNEIHRTISDPKRETVSSCTRGDWREPFKIGLSMCADLCRKHSIIATGTGTSVATFQQSASTQNPSFESLEQVPYGCPVVCR